MAGAVASPPGRRAASVLAWSLPAAVTAAATGIAVAAVSSGERVQLALCGGVVTIAMAIVVAETLRRGRALALLQDREADLARRVTYQEAQTTHLGQVVLPEAVRRIQQGEFVEEVLKDAADQEAGAPLQLQDAQLTVLRSVVEAVAAEEDLRESAQRAFVNIARRVQAIVHQQAQDLQDMEHRHGRNPEVFNDLLRLDHGFARVGRLADSMAVLGGARPGRQWSNPVPLYSVLRGAMSRILGYQRVELHSVSEIAVVGPAVEPLIHALAELLDNATLYSPPQTRVHLTAVDVQAGIAVEIEDGGLGLTEEGRARAERMLQEAQAGIDLNDLGETPRLGLAVVGRLARDYNFEVSLRPSAYRGVRAVLVIPQNLITTAPATGRIPGLAASSALQSPGRSAARAGAAPTGTAPTSPSGPTASVSWSALDDEAVVVTERTPGGLPQRRRHSAATTAGKPGAGKAAEPAALTRDAETMVQPGMWLSAFQNAVDGPAADSPAAADGPAANGPAADVRAPGTGPEARAARHARDSQTSDESSDEVE